MKDNFPNWKEMKSNAFKQELWEEMSFEEYLKLFEKEPIVACSAHQRMYQALIRWGKSKYTSARQEIIHYRFSEDPIQNGRDAIYGLDRPLMRLMRVLRAAAARLGQDRRIILLHGPVGSAKSTLARLIRKALEYHTRTTEGRCYTFSWISKESADREIFGLGESAISHVDCPLKEEPLKLLPPDVCRELLKKANEGVKLPEERIEVEGDPCPRCRQFYQQLLRKYRDDGEAWKKILSEHIRVRRLVFSEIDRVGLGSFRPKDEKNQDSTELTGDINYRKLAEYGYESDPRAFNFDGEFQISNRGFFYVEEMLKLDKAFLYDFLGATQEHKVKPKRFAEHDIDTVIMAGTNNPEFEKVRGDDTMEALRDRTTKIDIPYVIKLSEEEKIYAKIYQGQASGNRHIAPHTIRMASLWAILTRLNESKSGIDIRNKVRVYNGQMLPEFNEQKFIELCNESLNEGMSGISPRYIQDMLGSAAMGEDDTPCITWFDVKKKLEESLTDHPTIKKGGRDTVEKLKSLLAKVDEEYGDIVKSEVQKATVGGDEDVANLFKNYIANVVAFVRHRKVKDHKGDLVDPDTRFLAEVERELNVNGNNAEDYRHKIVEAMGERSHEKQEFDYKSDEQLHRALERLLFKRRKDTLRMSGLATGVVSREDTQKLEEIQNNLKKKYDYCDHCSALVIQHVAAIFARGDEQSLS